MKPVRDFHNIYDFAALTLKAWEVDKPAPLAGANGPYTSMPVQCTGGSPSSRFADASDVV